MGNWKWEMGNREAANAAGGSAMNDRNALMEKSLAFAIRVVRLNQYLVKEKGEYVLSKQLLRSGTSIGANVTEANDAYSKEDFLFKMYTALKECPESRYWIELLFRTDYITQTQYDSILADCAELQKLLTSTTKTMRKNLNANDSR